MNLMNNNDSKSKTDTGNSTTTTTIIKEVEKESTSVSSTPTETSAATETETSSSSSSAETNTSHTTPSTDSSSTSQDQHTTTESNHPTRNIWKSAPYPIYPRKPEYHLGFFLLPAFSYYLRKIFSLSLIFGAKKTVRSRSPTAFLKIKVLKFDNHSPDESRT